MNSPNFHGSSFFCCCFFGLEGVLSIFEMSKRVKVWTGGFMSWVGGVAEVDCRWRRCPLLSPSLHCSLYTVRTIKPYKSCKSVRCFVAERGGGAQPSDGQHAPQRRHARWSHAPGLLPGTSCPLRRHTAHSSVPSLPSSARSDLFSPSITKTNSIF